MGGVKRKIPTDKKIEKKESKSVAFSKRRKGLYSKTAQLCALSGAQVAILATPPCFKSNASFYSFGHSSVDNVVSAFLDGHRPREDHLGSEYWWDDQRLAESEDAEELSEAVASLSRMLQNLKGLRSRTLANREDAKKKKMKGVVVDQRQTLNLQSNYASSSGVHENLQGLVKEEGHMVEDNKDVVIHGTHQDFEGNKTLGFQPSVARLCIQDVSPEKVERFVNNSEQKDQMVASYDSNNGLLGNNMDGFNQDFDGNQTLGFQPSVASLCIQDVSPENVERFVNKSEQKDEIVASYDSNNGLLENMDDFLDLGDDLVGFEMNSKGFITTNLEMNDFSTHHYSSTGSGSGSGSEGAEDGAMVAVFDKDNALPADLYGCNQEFDTDHIFDLVTNTEDLSMNTEMNDVSMVMNQPSCSNSEAVEDGAMVVHKLDQDDLHFSDFFSGLFFNAEAESLSG